MPQDNSATPAGKNTENMKEKLIPASLYAAVMFLFFLAGCVGFSLGYDIIGKAGIILSGVFFILYVCRCIRWMLAGDEGTGNPFRNFFYY